MRTYTHHRDDEHNGDLGRRYALCIAWPPKRVCREPYHKDPTSSNDDAVNKILAQRDARRQG